MAKNPSIGESTCEACRCMGRGETRVSIQLEKEGTGMAYYICDGRLDGMGCSYRGKFGRNDTEALKREARNLEKQVDKPTIGEPADAETENGNTHGADREGRTEPAAITTNETGAGKGDDFLS